MAITLTIGGNARISYVAAKTLKTSTKADGSQGTLDVTLINPPTVPSVEDAIILADGATTLYSGTVRVVKLSQKKTNVWAQLSCQDDADPTGVPTAASFNLSDTPNNTTTFGFMSLGIQIDSIDGNIKTTGTAIIDKGGLVPGQNFQVTSANYGLSAAEYTIQEVAITYELGTVPIYTISFGDPIVRLAQVVRDIPDGYITETMISDKAISTPKLQAYSVTTLSNDGATVVIDENGITIDDGALNFNFPGGENVVLNSGFELGAFVAAPSSHTWTVATDWSTTRVRTTTNTTEGTELTLTGGTY
jgi:hypothetical protein